VPCCRYHRGEL